METITLVLTAATLQAIGTGLNELPYKIAAPAIAEVDAQVKAHIAIRDSTAKNAAEQKGQPEA